ncbi:hypothetical protein PPYR_08298 [Photinus pyralis]|uniref:Peroxisomal membrane protein PEX16 n=1 Tax=Photinus pyralis TaxID=7054 RepID=A0A1Y1K1W6_PHOPY|nr:peroxisomal membrane protein PEX16 [Photinus pyralis]KAB0797304.1 hypothetical protein PPYR_08298 [Photinus pyralis]
MSSALFSLPDLYNSYKSWVTKHPQTTSDFETTVKWVSYFIAGRINNSYIVSELVYSLSNLLVLFNDRIISQSHMNQPSSSQEVLKVWLTVLEYSEVFLELSALKLWGNHGKWFVIVCIQVFKCVSRMLLIFNYKDTVIENPPIPVLQRNNLDSKAVNENYTETQTHSISFTLQHSGRVIRKIDSSPPIAFRSWKPLEAVDCSGTQVVQQSILDKQLMAETLYALKPILHLGSVAYFGNNTWKPWIISLALDLYSLRLYRNCSKIDKMALSKKQKQQISRRTVVLLLYLLRSPFYDRHSKERISASLKCMAAKVPLANMICNPVLQYLPFWQKTYFYMWST